MTSSCKPGPAPRVVTAAFCRRVRFWELDFFWYTHMDGRIPGCFPECVFYCSNSPRGSEKPEIGPYAALPLFFILSQVRSQKQDFCHNIGWFCYCGQTGGHMGPPPQWDGRSVRRRASLCRLQGILSPVRPDEGIGPYGEGFGQSFSALQQDDRSVRRRASPCRLQGILSPVRPDGGIGPYRERFDQGFHRGRCPRRHKDTAKQPLFR